MGAQSPAIQIFAIAFLECEAIVSDVQEPFFQSNDVIVGILNLR